MLRVATLLLIAILFSFYASYGQVRNDKILSSSLKSIMAKKRGEEVVDLLIASKDSSYQFLSRNIHIISTYKNISIIRIPISDIPVLINSGKILFADIRRVPKEELTSGSLDLSLNKISLAHHFYPFINGDSIKISIKEQQFDTTDIDIKERSFSSGLQAPTQSSHASIMATIIAGGGNSSPFSLGAAPASLVTSSDFASLLPDPDSVFDHYNISIQNHSYGTAIENYYGVDAAAYDLSAYINPKLVYVFSAGNSGTSVSASGQYSGLQGWANLTGSFKMAKNILTVGATDSFNNVGSLSSRGPLFDGRVGPDLVAFGEDGTSGAAALVSGSSSLIQQLFKHVHLSLPSSALIRSILINSADEIGSLHVNYISGFGSLNTFRALQTIREDRYQEDVINKNEIRTFNIHVPSGIAKLKITLAWTDTPSIANSSRPLVNDLDAKLVLSSSGQSWLPWVLNPSSNVDSLMLPAQRKIDTLNTIEQISVDDPDQGDYTLQIDGSKILTAAPQPFAISWQLDTAKEIYWVYPTASDVLVAGMQNVIQWQSNDTGKIAVSYSIDGINWNLIDSNVNLSAGYVKWNAPDTFSNCILKMVGSGIGKVSDSFVISRILSLQVGFDCTDSFLLYWNNVHADSYLINSLGEKYMQPVQNVTDSFVVFKKKDHPELYYNVIPIRNGKKGLAGFTVNYTMQGANCFLRSFYALPNGINKALLTVELGTLYNVASIDIQKWNGKNYVSIHVIESPVSLTQNYIDSQLVRGLNLYKAIVILKNGQQISSSIETVSYFPDLPVLIFPNPSQQQHPVSIIVKDQGIYSIRIMDALGKTVKYFDLNDITTSIPPFTLSKGIYFIQIYSSDKNISVQKLIIY